MPEMSLDLIGISEGTDKHSLEHDYLRHYERLFEPFRTAKIDVIEIGVAGGASLRTWRRYFTQARIVGIDIHPHCRQYADEKNGVIVEIGSQDDPGFLTDLCQRYRPSIIIDDGSHLAHHMQFSFERLFPALLPGGCYLIEDMPFHFGEHATVHNGTAATRMPDYLAKLAFGLLGEPLPRGGFRAEEILRRVDRPHRNHRPGRGFLEEGPRAVDRTGLRVDRSGARASRPRRGVGVVLRTPDHGRFVGPGGIRGAARGRDPSRRLDHARPPRAGGLK